MTLNSKILRTTTTCRCTSPATRSLESIPQGPTFDLGKNDDPNVRDAAQSFVLVPEQSHDRTLPFMYQYGIIRVYVQLYTDHHPQPMRFE